MVGLFLADSLKIDFNLQFNLTSSKIYIYIYLYIYLYIFQEEINLFLCISISYVNDYPGL